MTGAGRFAPSPSGDLHVGNLRTALLAWLFARHTGRSFLLRIEDLDDRSSSEVADRQVADLTAIGLDFDGDPVVQSQRRSRYDEVIDGLDTAGMTFECFCTRKEILAAPRAPHSPPGAYPGTCRDLDEGERAERRESGRPPAIRLRSDITEFTVQDELCGTFTGVVDDFVLRRGDGVAAYNLAVVVDDADSGVDQVVRADDLLSSTPRQAYLAQVLGLPVPTYAHVPLVLNTFGTRLAKRDGAVTLTTLASVGVSAERVRAQLAGSLGLGDGSETPDPATLLARFDPSKIPAGPWILDPVDLL
ncbi:tRNA glutamyl-Q(34) synthetase GluQRS [Williamsia deligens]|uniref:Glutamyl-Q tRNA(Asp) synthetase n=1 Tax=Williamsia deligens TaxID=321325 RepID=A0ABW3G5L8_9NOCA|nr:tRNA glutamyl-Q(34) synthetase GluQRS [Williamsia deligens]MCP2193468.1 glutamyl-tRNA synthetase [Williamsia deligens]